MKDDPKENGCGKWEVTGSLEKGERQTLRSRDIAERYAMGVGLGFTLASQSHNRERGGVPEPMAVKSQCECKEKGESV